MITKAIAIAKNNEEDFRFGAVIVGKSKKVLAMSQNSLSKTHPVQQMWSSKVSNGKQIYLHAEIAALVKCRKQPYAIYIARVLKDDTPALARPCNVCMAAMKEAGVKKVYYTIRENEIGVIKL